MHSVKLLLAIHAAILVVTTANAVNYNIAKPQKQHECDGMRVLKEKLQFANEINQKLITKIKSLTRNSSTYSLFEIEPLLMDYSTTCNNAMKTNDHGDGIYQIYLPNSNLKTFNVYCMKDPNNGTAWTVFQRRYNGGVDFLRNWNEYKNGFGNLTGEFWLGLDKLHALTNSRPHEIWIQLKDFEGNAVYAKYNDFLIADEAGKYAMRRLGRYEGDAGDSFSYHRGQNFSTPDSDNDSSKMRNCAAAYSGAWWYNACDLSNLNGLYLYGAYSCNMHGKGVIWQSYRNFLYSLKYTHMAIRPAKYN